MNWFTFSVVRKQPQISRFKWRNVITGLMGLCVVAPANSPANSLEELELRLENMGLQRLAEVQAESALPVYAFTTDGCSGGLSEGWNYVASLLPDFAERYGSLPPWEECCVRHDRAYWQGAAKDGFHLRKQADLDLKQCVIEHGRRAAENLSAQQTFTAEQVRVAYQAAAELMFHAVRVGGRPCTVFAWRWGYGWPRCDVFFGDTEKGLSEPSDADDTEGD